MPQDSPGRTRPAMEILAGVLGVTIGGLLLWNPLLGYPIFAGGLLILGLVAIRTLRTRRASVPRSNNDL